MLTVNEYAQLAARTYDRTRANKMTLSADIEETHWQDDDPITGFSAGVYQKGNQVVIAFTGSNETLVKDFAVANVPAGMGLGAAQITRAAELVIDTLRRHPKAELSFTGHSLGGGLASVMAVLFNKPATVFDHAPFKATALNRAALYTLYGYLKANGYENPEFAEYVSPGGDGLRQMYEARKENVSVWYVGGEILSIFRDHAEIIGAIARLASRGRFGHDFGAINGTGKEYAIPVNRDILPDIDWESLSQQTPAEILEGLGISLQTAMDLHSMVLLLGLRHSEAFRKSVADLPGSLEMMFDTDLYTVPNPEFDPQEDIWARLVKQQVGGVNRFFGEQEKPDDLIAAQPVLDRMAEDFNRLAAALPADSALRQAVMAQLIEWFYHQTEGYRYQGDLFFRQAADGLLRYTHAAGEDYGGGINLREDGTTVSSNRSHKYTLPWLDGVLTEHGIDRPASSLADKQQWSLATGQQGVHADAAGSALSQLMAGGEGDDLLLGGSGDDLLLGGGGANILAGGQGRDVYRIAEGSNNLIADADGAGYLEWKGLRLSGGRRLLDGNTWYDEANHIAYSLIENGTLFISHHTLTSAFTVRIQNWQPGMLGLDMGKQPAASSLRAYVGDFRAKLTGIEIDLHVKPGEPGYNTYKWTSAQRLPDGRLNNGVYEPDGFDDIIFGSAAGDHIEGRLGHDALDGGAGDDVVEGGDGDDKLYGDQMDYTSRLAAGSAYLDLRYHGRDTLYGGRGSDELVGDGNHDHLDGGEGDDRLWGDNGNGVRSKALSGNDYLYGRAGKDYLEGGYGNDRLYGGTDDDYLLGGGDSDFLYGEQGNDELWGDDGSSTPVADHGADYVDGGAGDDLLIGGRGDDTLTGGDGHDRLWGDDVKTEAEQNPEISGRDHLDGGAGNDYLNGGLDADTLKGGAGGDTLFGGAGKDLLYGDEGDDHLIGDNAAVEAGLLNDGQDHGDTLLGGEGRDQLVGAWGDDHLYGGEGDDSLWGDLGVPPAQAAAGMAGNDVLDGGSGSDVLYGNAGDDVLLGGEGSDRLTGGTGNDYLNGQAGNDVYFIGNGDGRTTVDDSEGISTLAVDALADWSFDFDRNGLVMRNGIEGDALHISGYYLDHAAAAANWQPLFLADRSGNAPIDLQELFEIKGSRRTGGNGADDLHGYFTDDHLAGGAGNDILNGRAGNDVLVGGTGADTYVFSGRWGHDTVYAEQAEDHMYFRDTLLSEVRFIRDGTDLLVVRHDTGGSVRIVRQFADGADWTAQGVVNWEFADGTIVKAADVPWLALNGSENGERIVGSDGGEDLNGYGGNDTLLGMGGNDVINGGTGNDLMAGGAGADTYVFSGEWGRDTVVARQAEDHVYFKDSLLSDLDFSRSGADLYVRRAQGDGILFKGQYAGGGSWETAGIVNWEFADGEILDAQGLKELFDTGRAQVQASAPADAAYFPTVLQEELYAANTGILG